MSTSASWLAAQASSSDLAVRIDSRPTCGHQHRSSGHCTQSRYRGSSSQNGCSKNCYPRRAAQSQALPITSYSMASSLIMASTRASIPLPSLPRSPHPHRLPRSQPPSPQRTYRLEDCRKEAYTVEDSDFRAVTNSTCDRRRFIGVGRHTKKRRF